MKKFVCNVCGYVYEGDAAPEKCPVCGAPAEKFTEQSGEMSWAAEHVVGVAQGSSEDIMEDLRANYEGECKEVGMYLAMARVAHREGYPEIGLYKLRTELPPANSIWLNVQKQQTWTLSMTQFMKWQETKLVTEKLSQDF